MTTLLGWLGKTGPPAKEPTPVSMRSLSPVKRNLSAIDDRVVLGVLGTRSNIRYEEFVEQILAPIVEAWGVPDEIVLPAESESTQVIQTWAATQKIPLRLVACDWARQGKRAGLLRDAQIQREASHFVLLQGPRSNAMTILATRLEQKRRPVVISVRPGRPVATPAESRDTL
jgi:hypothetical protein